MEFTDFKDNPTELIGKTVGIGFDEFRGWAKIIRVGKKSFTTSDGDRWSLDFTGNRTWGYGGNGGNCCQLLTGEEFEALKIKHKLKSEAKAMRAHLTGKLPSLTYEQLTKIMEIVNPQK
jgi:hypothetical protein